MIVVISGGNFFIHKLKLLVYIIKKTLWNNTTLTRVFPMTW